MYQKIVSDVVRKFGLDVAEVGEAEKGYRNESYCLTLVSNERVNLIFHKNEREALNRIESADKASDILTEAYPVRTRYDKRTLRIASGSKTLFTGIYTYMPGKTIPWEAYTKDHIKLLGWAMSDMHAAWRASAVNFSAHLDDELSLIAGRMCGYFDSAQVRLAVQDKLGLQVIGNLKQYERLFKQLHNAPRSSRHILHMDLVRGNVLFDASSESPWRIDSLNISGVIDFEKAAMGHPAYDIARTLAFLLVDCAGKDRHSIYKYFLQSGYNKRGASSFKRSDTVYGMPSYKVLTMLIGFFLLHDFYKFLKHTPYESLESNHHFKRTRDILIDYGMIRYYKD